MLKAGDQSPRASVLALWCVQGPQALSLFPAHRPCSPRAPGMQVLQWFLMRHSVVSMELPRRRNLCHPLKIPATKSVPKAVGGMKEELFKLAQES